MPITTLNQRETAHRFDPGLDWGATRRVLARTPDRSVMLFVTEGYYGPVCGVRGFGRKWNPAHTILYAARDWDGRMAGHRTQRLAEGRLNMKRLQKEHGRLIDRVFATPDLSLFLESGKTLVVEPEPRD